MYARFHTMLTSLLTDRLEFPPTNIVPMPSEAESQWVSGWCKHEHALLCRCSDLHEFLTVPVTLIRVHAAAAPRSAGGVSGGCHPGTPPSSAFRQCTAIVLSHATCGRLLPLLLLTSMCRHVTCAHKSVLLLNCLFLVTADPAPFRPCGTRSDVRQEVREYCFSVRQCGVM